MVQEISQLEEYYMNLDLKILKLLRNKKIQMVIFRQLHIQIQKISQYLN